jgi:hypothetical protein
MTSPHGHTAPAQDPQPGAGRGSPDIKTTMRHYAHVLNERRAGSQGRGAVTDFAKVARSQEVPYFHVVFSLPAQIADIAYQNKAVIYDIPFTASAETLITIAADPKHLGARKHASCAADKAPAALNITSLFLRPRTFSARQHNVVRPFPLEIAAGDFTFAAGHHRNAISFVAGTLNSAAAFSMAGIQMCFGLCDPPHNSPELG